MSECRGEVCDYEWWTNSLAPTSFGSHGLGITLEEEKELTSLHTLVYRLQSNWSTLSNLLTQFNYSLGDGIKQQTFPPLFIFDVIRTGIKLVLSIRPSTQLAFSLIGIAKPPDDCVLEI